MAQQQVVNGLRQKGFNIIDNQPAPSRNLTVEVKFLDYSTSTGFWTGGVNVRSALKVIAQHDGNTYEQLYRTDKAERVVVVPTAETNQQWINAALSDALRQLLNDQGRINFLSQK